MHNDNGAVLPTFTVSHTYSAAVSTVRVLFQGPYGAR